MSVIKTAIIGFGDMGQQTATAISSLPNVEISSICELQPIYNNTYNATLYQNIEDFLIHENPHVICVCLPDELHYETILRCLHSYPNAQILCEKPLANSLQQALTLANHTSFNRIAVNFSYRNSTSLNQLSRIIASNTLGPIEVIDIEYLQSWDYERNSSIVTESGRDWRHKSIGGIVADLGSHVFDALNFLGIKLAKISALGSELYSNHKTIDRDVLKHTTSKHVFIQFTSQKQITGTIRLSKAWHGHSDKFTINIIFSQGRIHCRLGAKDQLGLFKGESPRFSRISDPRKYKTTYEEFIYRFKNGITHHPSLVSALIVQELIDKTLQSIALKGKKMTIQDLL